MKKSKRNKNYKKGGAEEGEKEIKEVDVKKNRKQHRK
jgi:hypothetical protein